MYIFFKFLIFLIDKVKLTRSIWNLVTQSKSLKANIKYLDMNNWYGYVMSKFLPSQIDRSKRVWLTEIYASNISRGCVLEVDIEFPKEL